MTIKTHPPKMFRVLFLLARPGAGKSEVIHYLHGLSPEERLERFHIGRMEEIDDFPFLWTWFEEDDTLTSMGQDRLHTTTDGYFKKQAFWNLLIRRIGLEYQKKLRDDPIYHTRTTSIIEFSRGSEHGGYREAFENILPVLAADAAILYIQVSYEESLRKNLLRADPNRPDSILHHSLTTEKMEQLYKETDWDVIAGRNHGFVEIRSCQVPYVVMNNEDDVTTEGGTLLGERLQTSLNQLWASYLQVV